MSNDSGERELLYRYFNWAAHAPDLELERPSDVDWDALVGRTKGHLARLAGRNPRDVSLHHNTTGAFQRITTRLRLYFEGTSPVLLLTDQEYPGIVALLDEQWHGPIVMIRTADCIWNGKPQEVLHRLLLGIRQFKPQVILLSHVARTTGLRLTDAWLEEVSSRAPGSIVILDGAQAMGNVHVSETALRMADFYVFSGHKWLRSLATLGVVIARQDEWSVDDPAQGYSSQAGSRGTGSEWVLGSLVGSFRRFEFLGTRNYEISVAEKAEELAKLLEGRGIRHVGLPNGSGGFQWPWNGIVSVPLGDHRPSDGDDLVYSILYPEVFRSAALGWVAAGPRFLVSFPGDDHRDDGVAVEHKTSFCDVSVPCPPLGVGRFCVTWEHRSEDLQHLADAIARRCVSAGASAGVGTAGRSSS